MSDLLRSLDWPAYIQAFGSIAAIIASVWLAGIPVRAAERERAAIRAERLDAIRTAAEEISGRRVAVANAILDGDAVGYELASKLLDSSDHYEARSVLKLPVEYWPTIALHSAMARLHDAAASLDKHLTNASWGVVRGNPHVFRFRAREMRDAAIAFKEALLRIG